MNYQDRVIVYDDGFLKVEKIQDRIKEKPVVRESLVTPDSVAGVMIDESGRFGFVKQYRPTVGDYTYEIVSGICDKDIDNSSILVEEIEEECEISKIDILKMEFLHEYYAMIGISDTRLFLYEVKVRKQESKTVSDSDVSEVLWITLEEFENMIKDETIKDSKTLLAYYYIKANLKE